MQNNSCTNVCRFCLEKSDRNFETIEDVTFANLDFLWLKLNLSISEEPVMCGECAKTIRNCSDFKKKCLDAESFIVSCVKEKDSFKVDLQEVYVCKMSTENIVNVPEHQIVCRLCLELVENDSAVFLSNRSDIIQKLEQYFPELDLTYAEDLVICASCQVSLQRYFSFIKSCLTTEEKIIEYCKVEGTNCIGQINLNSIIHFISKDFLKRKFEVDIVKIEETYNEVSENASNNVEVKKEEVLDMELDIKEDSYAQESELTDENRLQRHPSPSQPDHIQLTNAKSARYTCGYTQKEDTEVTIYKCDLCDYETKRKFDLKVHMLIHKTPSEITMYKCIHCGYEGKRKSHLSAHMLIHKTHSEITMHKCEACTYETKYKRCLRQHTLTHMDESEIKLHKCEVCPFKTKWYGSFHEHRRSHRSTAEVVTRGTTYKCDLCEYEAKKRSHLTTHTLIHKTYSEITTFKCDLCDYEAKRKADLKRHTLTHKTLSEITVYKCHLCDYVGKQKPFLKRHMLVHKTPSEITMYKCETCAYETKHKDYLHKHKLIHMDVSEIEMHKCKVCSFETKRRETLRKHLLTHKTPSEITMYKCETCAYETKFKDYLHKHRLIHMDVSEIKMYKCEMCPFKSKWDSSLRTHQLSHRNTPDVPSNIGDM